MTTRFKPMLSESEREKIFDARIRSSWRRRGIYDGRELAALAARMGENPESVRARLKKAGFILGKSRSGTRDVWIPSQSPQIHEESNE